MPPHMKPQDWTHFINEEYLGSFVKAGGAAIKFAVPLDEEARRVLSDELDNLASAAGYLVVNVSATDTKVHMIEQIFFRIADQIPWQSSCERVIIKLAGNLGYRPPSDGDTSLLLRIAHENQIEPEMVGLELKRQITGRVLKERDLSKDFRIAMTQICLAQLTGGAEGETTVQVLTDWLTGRNTRIGPVKPYQIFSPINRANARYIFESLLRWMRFAGYMGVLVVLDMTRIAVAKNPKDDHPYYTKAAVLDTYEVLRQFIDGTDRLIGCLIVVVPDVAFLDDDPRGRGIGVYPALKFRVFDEIRDRKLVNPMASLVRLSSLTAEAQQ